MACEPAAGGFGKGTKLQAGGIPVKGEKGKKLKDKLKDKFGGYARAGEVIGGPKQIKTKSKIPESMLKAREERAKKEKEDKDCCIM